MNWTAEAEQLLEKMPAFVSDRFRKKLEDEATRQKRTKIDSVFVKKHQGGHQQQG